MEILKAVSDFIFVSDELTKADVIIIPGSSRTELAQRAAELLEQGYAEYVIVSGADNKKLKESEAEFLYDQLVKMGKCKELKIDTDKIIIVCKNYHSRRVKLTFESVFKGSKIMIAPVCDSTGITSFNWYRSDQKRRIVFGEVEKIGRYMPDIIQTDKETK